MYPTSDAYKAALAANNRTWRLKLKMDFDGGDSLSLTNRDVILGTFSYDESSICSDNLDIGSTYANGIQFSLENGDGRFNKQKFAYAKITAEVGLLTTKGTWEDIPLGVFFVTENAKKLSTIPIKALDAMYLLNRSTDTLTILPNSTPYDIMRSMATKFGFSMTAETETLVRSSNLVLPVFHDEKVSCRDFTGYCAALFGKSARFNRQGKLEFFYVSDTVYETTSVTRTLLDLSDIVIEPTGVRITDASKNTSQMGPDGYLLEIAANPLLINEEITSFALSNAFAALTKIQYLPYTCSLIGDPSIQCGDRVHHLDKAGNRTASIITGLRFKFRGESQIEAKGKTPESDRQLTQSAKKLIEVEQKAEQDLNLGLNNLEHTILNQSALLTSSMGFYPYAKKDADGKLIGYYLMDDPDQTKAETVWAFTGNGIGVSHTGIDGPYTSSWTSDDSIVAKSISTYFLTVGEINSVDGSLAIDLENGKFETTTALGTCTIKGNEVILACQDDETGKAVSSMVLSADSVVGDEAVNMKIVLSSNDNTVTSYLEQSFDYDPETGNPVKANPLLLSTTEGLLVDKDLAVADAVVYDHLKMQRKTAEEGNTGVDFVLTPRSWIPDPPKPVEPPPPPPANLFLSEHNPGFESGTAAFAPWVLRAGSAGSARATTTDKHSGSACLQQNYSSWSTTYIRAPIKTPAKRFYIGCWMKAISSCGGEVLMTPNADGSSAKVILVPRLTQNRWVYESAIVETNTANFLELRAENTVFWDDFFLCEAGEHTKEELDDYVKSLYPDAPDSPEYLENLLDEYQNPGFEFDSTSIAPWEVVSDSEISTRFSHSGTNSLCQQGESCVATSPVLFKSGRYYIGCWVRVTSPDTVAVLFLDDDSVVLEVDASSPGHWIYQSAIVDLIDANNLKLVTNTHGIVYWDDFFLCEAGNHPKSQLDAYVQNAFPGDPNEPVYPGNLFDESCNPGFENGGLDPWYAYINASGSSTDVIGDPELAHSGEFYLSQDGISLVLAPVQTPETNFYFGCWSRRDAGAQTSAVALGPTDSFTVILDDNSSTNGEWIYQSVLIDNDKAQEITIACDSSDPIYWDDFFMCESEGFTKEELDGYIMGQYPYNSSGIKNLFQERHNPGFELRTSSIAPWVVQSGSDNGAKIITTDKHAGSCCLQQNASYPSYAYYIRSPIKTPAERFYIACWCKTTSSYGDGEIYMTQNENGSNRKKILLPPLSQNRWTFRSAIVENDAQNFIDLRAGYTTYWDDFFLCEVGDHTKKELDDYVKSLHPGDSDIVDDPEYVENLLPADQNPGFEKSTTSFAPWRFAGGDVSRAGISTRISHSGSNSLYQKDGISTIKFPIQCPAKDFYIGCWIRISTPTSNVLVALDDLTTAFSGNTEELGYWVYHSAIVKSTAAQDILLLVNTDGIVYWDDFFLCEPGLYSKAQLDGYAKRYFAGNPKEPDYPENLFLPDSNPGFEWNPDSIEPWTVLESGDGEVGVFSDVYHSGSFSLYQNNGVSLIQAPINTPAKNFYIGCWTRRESDVNLSGVIIDSLSNGAFGATTSTNGEWVYQSAIMENSSESIIYILSDCEDYVFWDDFFLCESDDFTKEELDDYVMNQYEGGY